MDKVYVCSPLSAPTKAGVRQNMINAREYASLISDLFHVRAVAPHGYMPMFLDDLDPVERNLAMEFDLKLLSTCQALVVCGGTITAGMDKEIKKAGSLGLPVYQLQVANHPEPVKITIYFTGGDAVEGKIL